MSDWRIFFWAMLHSAEFKDCCIIMPIRLRLQLLRTYPGWSVTWGVSFQSPGIYIPWSVKKAFYTAHDDQAAIAAAFDDIPF